jgi:hypothetical protein
MPDAGSYVYAIALENALYSLFAINLLSLVLLYLFIFERFSMLARVERLYSSALH